MQPVRFAVRLFNRLTEDAAVLLYAAMMIVAAVQVFFRYALGSPLTWTEEVARYLFVWMVFLGAAVALLRVGSRGHISLDFMHGFLAAPVRNWLVFAINVAVGFVVVRLMVIEGWALAMRTMRQASPATGLPIGWIYLAIPVAGALMTLFVAYRLLEFLRFVASGRDAAPAYEEFTHYEGEDA